MSGGGEAGMPVDPEPVPPIVVPPEILRDAERSGSYEWLEPNGLGGWAASTVTGRHTRRYHGLLVAATQPPAGRMVLLSRLDETLIQDERRELATCRFPGAMHPRGCVHLDSFAQGLFPVWEYAVDGIRLRKTIVAVNGAPTTLILYEVIEGPDAPFTLELQPFFASRDYHSLAHANDSIRREATFADDVLRYAPYAGVPEIFIQAPGARFTSDGAWYYNYEYDAEAARGMESREDLYTCGVLTVELARGQRLGILISTEPPGEADAFVLVDREAARRRAVVAAVASSDPIVRRLALAADMFVVPRGADLRTIIAGYHWFTDWGRDTMIALPGLCLVTGRFDDARKILQAFADSVSEGMLPNRFPDAGETPEYNTVDATLWFFVAIHHYLRYTGDLAFVRDALLPVLRNMVAWHDRGTRYGIRVTADGLLTSGEPGVQLTWMDAKVGDWVVTPRHGKAVEINALWYNALAILADVCRQSGSEAEAEGWAERARRVVDTFGEVFWNDDRYVLFDVVSDSGREAAIRPNQIFAISLPYPLLDGAKAAAVLREVTEHLLTPVGLRSLSPSDSAYRPHYGGNPHSRDGAYHQGTVWSWLLGPYVTALRRVQGADGAAEGRRLLEAASLHLAEAGLGTVSEIFDAEPPHVPRGCVAQAWGVSEWLRAYMEDATAETDVPLRRRP